MIERYTFCAIVGINIIAQEFDGASGLGIKLFESILRTNRGSRKISIAGPCRQQFSGLRNIGEKSSIGAYFPVRRPDSTRRLDSSSVVQKAV
jgi:hypothetical protein